MVAEALQLSAPVEVLIAAPDLLVSDFGRSLLDQAQEKGITTLEVSDEVFASLSVKEGPQGLAALVHEQWTSLDQSQPAPGDIWVALDTVADPGNLGTILRTGDAAGARGVILLDQSTDPYDPTALRASMGAVFAQQLIRATHSEFAGWQRRGGYIVVGTSDAAAVDYHHARYPNPVILLMGSERQGLSEGLLAMCSQVVRIPMAGRSDSLNLAVATGIVLYEVINQRRDKRGVP